MKVLIIDCNIEPPFWGAGDLVHYAKKAPQSTIYVRRAPQSDLPLSYEAFDKVIVSGSLTSVLDSPTWVLELEEVIKKIIQLGIPLLGVCYGHQLIMRTLGGLDFVGRGERSEFGWTDIEIHQPSALFAGLPKKIVSFSSHYDVVRRLVPEAELLASSPDCEIQAYQLRDKPVYCVQFHPEKTLQGADIIYKEQQEKGEEKRVMRYKEGKNIYNPLVAETIFKNFLNI